jgi:hypothetical protein
MTHKRRKRVKTLRDGLRAYFPSECVIHERNKFAAVVFSQLDSPVFVVPARFNGRRVIRVGLAVAPSTELEATPGLVPDRWPADRG